MNAGRKRTKVFSSSFARCSAISAVKAFELMTTQPTHVKDPVCGMTVDPAKAKATAEHDGQKYYFCCAGCAQKFQSDPEAYLKLQPMLVTIGGAATTKPKPIEQIPTGSYATQKPAAAYVCPM